MPRNRLVPLSLISFSVVSCHRPTSFIPYLSIISTYPVTHPTKSVSQSCPFVLPSLSPMTHLPPFLPYSLFPISLPPSHIPNFDSPLYFSPLPSIYCTFSPIPYLLLFSLSWLSAALFHNVAPSPLSACLYVPPVVEVGAPACLPHTHTQCTS